MKSLIRGVAPPLILNELADELEIESISNSAFTQRRALLKHGFFIESN
jgi:hypothetical protein